MSFLQNSNIRIDDNTGSVMAGSIYADRDSSSPSLDHLLFYTHTGRHQTDCAFTVTNKRKDAFFNVRMVSG